MLYLFGGSPFLSWMYSSESHFSLQVQMISNQCSLGFVKYVHPLCFFLLLQSTHVPIPIWDRCFY